MSDATDIEVLDAYPGEIVDHDTKHLYRGFLGRRLVVQQCAACGRWQLPPRPCCPDCWSPELVPTEVAGRGRVLWAIRLHQGPAAPGVDYAEPYPVVAVDLEEQVGLRFTAPLVDHDGPSIRAGLEVELTWIERAAVPWPAFRPRGAV